MKILKFYLMVAFVGISFLAKAQAPVTLDTARMSYNEISQKIGVFLYPTKGQSKSQQKQDEYQCYQWAVEQSGVDPLNPPKIEAAPQQTGPTGGAIVGGAKGAAAGAAIGAIAGDAGKGAAIGAVAGGLAGRRAGKMAQAESNQQAQANVSAQEQQLRDTFKRAFSVCIEGKGYTVK
jgi:outer membrane lipoprotein SlyB